MSILIFIFTAAVVIQFVFFALLSAGIRRTNAQTRKTEPPPVSVLVCAHNEEDNLKTLIPRLLAQEYPCFEVIVVDDRSNDGTYDYLRNQANEDKRLRVVTVDHLPDHVNSKKYAITLGIKAASYDWILLTDADCLPASLCWLAGMSAFMDEKAQFILGYSPYEKKTGLLNQFIRFETLLTAFQYIGFARLGMPYMGVGRNLAYRKSYFLANKGFNSLIGITGGDDDLYVNRHAKALTTRVCIGEPTLTYSKPEDSLQNFFAQKKRHLFAGKFYRFKHRLVIGAFIGSYLLVWVTGLTLVWFWHEPVFTGTLLMARTAFFAVLITQAAKRFGSSFNGMAVPLLDILFVFYYLSTAPVAWVTKNVKWKS